MTVHPSCHNSLPYYKLQKKEKYHKSVQLESDAETSFIRLTT